MPVTFGTPGDLRLRMRCANMMAARVENGKYPPGEWLPTMKEIGEEWGISTATVAQAVRMLCAEGLLTHVKGIGYYAGGDRPPDPPWKLRNQDRAARRREAAQSLPDVPEESPVEPHVTVSHLAAQLGLHTSTIYELIAEGKLEGTKRIGKVRGFRIPVSSVDKYLKSCLTHPTGAEVEGQPDSRARPPVLRKEINA